ncbi:vacuolar sorting-associated 13c [Brachionus plicatilis]|uniref:Vacuolar sorting-associated 13c n=1 Tax=Brachionus plicatilis TaxID=10195 RepID=A0A3M7PI97_BRAPC|nr:vacuolar sorting-associated 13c [Brachionus plicatilis]
MIVFFMLYNQSKGDFFSFYPTVRVYAFQYSLKYSLEPKQEQILGWYCDCKSGSRVFGACAHVTSVLWFMGVEKHKLGQLDKKKRNLLFKFILDCDKDKLEREDSLILNNECDSTDE